GRFTLLAAGTEQPPLRWTGTRETLYVSMDAAVFDRLVDPELRAGHAGSLGLRAQHGVDDPAVARLLLSMLDDATAGCPHGALYGESLCLALARYLLGRFGAPP